MKFGIIVLDGFDVGADGNICFQLLADFSCKCRLRCFSCLDLSSGEFPPILIFAIATLSSKDSVPVPNNGGNNMDTGLLSSSVKPRFVIVIAFIGIHGLIRDMHEFFCRKTGILCGCGITHRHMQGFYFFTVPF